MAKIKIINNVQVIESDIDFNSEKFNIMVLDLPFYIVINKHMTIVSLEYKYMREVSPVQRLDTSEFKVYFGQYSGRITKLELKIQDITDSNWRYLLKKFKELHKNCSTAFYNFSYGVELAKDLNRRFVLTNK